MTPTRTYLRPDHEGASTARYLVSLKMADGGALQASALAAESLHCRSTPEVSRALFEVENRKSAVGAQALSATDPYGIGTTALLLQSSIAGALFPRFRQAAFRTKMARETGAGAAAAWRGEGLPAVNGKTLFDTTTVEPLEAAILVPLTTELVKFGTRTEQTIIETVQRAIAKFVDAQLLDPSITATSAHPASITNSAGVVTSTGSSAAQIIADLASLIAAIETSGDSLTWVMRPLTYHRICAALAGVGLTVAPGTLLNIPVVTGSTSPQQVTLIDCAFSLDLSTRADVQMDSAPNQSGISGTGASMVSLFQSNLTAVMASLRVNWQGLFPGAGSPTVDNSGVGFMTVAY